MIWVEKGLTIHSVKITYAVKNTGILLLDGEQIASDVVVEGIEDSFVTFSVSATDSSKTNGQVQITAIEVVYSGVVVEEKPGEGEDEKECEHTFVEGVCTECGEADPDYKPVVLTAEEILNALYALEAGASLTGEYTLTGKITALDGYKNPTIVVEGFEDKPVYCYYFSVNDAFIGDMLTVTATGMKNYNGTYEFTNCTLVELVPHTHNYTSTVTPATCTAAGYTTYTCGICNNSYKADETAALGHTTDNGTCGNCGQEINAANPSLEQKSYAYTLAKGDVSYSTVTLGGVAWTFTGDSTYLGWDSNASAKGVQLGSGNAPNKSLTVTSASFSNVSKITINTSGAKDINGTCDVYVGDTKVGTITLTTTATDYSFDVAGLTGEVKLVYSQSSSKAIYIKSLAVEYAVETTVVTPPASDER